MESERAKLLYRETRGQARPLATVLVLLPLSIVILGPGSVVASSGAHLGVMAAGCQVEEELAKLKAEWDLQLILEEKMRHQSEKGGLRMLRRMFWERAKGELGLRVEIWRLRARDANEQSKARHGYGQLSSLGHRHEAASMKKAMADHGGEWRREVLEVIACRMLPSSRPLHGKRRVETVFASLRSVHTIAVAVSTLSQLQYLPLVLFWPY